GKVSALGSKVGAMFASLRHRATAPAPTRQAAKPPTAAAPPVASRSAPQPGTSSTSGTAPPPVPARAATPAPPPPPSRSRIDLAALIRRSCLSSTRTSRDRADFVALGADPAVLREIDGCVRRAAAARASEAPPAPPHRPPLSGVRSGFVLGVGQHGAAGAHPP